jgi:peptidoglycan L-alanyl-D-glutamate endopeptidase CwlK
MINSRQIKDLHPIVKDLCEKHIAACEKRGIKIITTSTLRDNQYQATLYAQGRTKAGSIITNMKAVGAHGFGLAYDVVATIAGNAIWNDNAVWKIIGEEGKKLGLVWGGDWKSIVDKPHFEYTEKLTGAQLRAGLRPSWWNSKKLVEIPKVVIRPGAEVSNDIKILQTQLNKFGYKLKVDGDYGKLSQGAVKDFQEVRGLTKDGIVGPATWKKLFE